MTQVYPLPAGTRLQRIDRMPDGSWRLWIATADFVLGTYINLLPDNTVCRVTERDDEGPDMFNMRGYTQP